MEPDETDVDPTDADETDVDEEPAQPIAPRRRSTGGQMLGAALLGLGEIYNGPKKDQHVIEVEASGDPPNIDTDGLDELLSDGSRLTGPPLDRVKAGKRKRRMRNRS